MLVYPYPTVAGTAVCECTTPKWGIEFVEFRAEPIMEKYRKQLEETLDSLMGKQQMLNGGKEEDLEVDDYDYVESFIPQRVN